MSIRALIFDMDGVIVDSNPWHRTAWEEYNRSLGVTMTEEMQQRMYGKRNDELIREFFGQDLGDAEVFAHGAAKEVLYRAMMKPHLNDALVPGIREFLARHKDLPLAVATNAEQPNVDFVLDETGLRPFFRVVVNGHDVVNPKPHPEIYLRVADALGIAPADCVVFEDSHTGVEAALAAGMKVVGISTTHDDLAGVSLLIPDFNDPALETWLSGEQSKTIVFTKHGRDRCLQRGATEADVIRAIQEGRREPAQRGLWQYRLNLEYQKEWAGNWYAVRQVIPVVAEEKDRLVVITVYTYFF